MESGREMESLSETKFQIALLPEASDQVGSLADAGPIEWLLCKPTGDSSYEFRQGDKVISVVDLEDTRFDLESLLGIVVVGDEDKFQEFKNRWTLALPSIAVSLKSIPEWENGAITRAALECVANHLALQRRHSGRAAIELATYRREFDRLQRSFSRLEEYVGRHSFREPIEIFEYPPATETASGKWHHTQIGQILEAGRHSLIQSLPTDSLGISGLSIYVSAKPASPGEFLRIQLKAIETEFVFGEWRLSAPDVRIGWVELALNHAIDEPALSLAVVVEWPCEESGWSLALGPPHPFEEFCARTEASHYFRAPLAMRLFNGLPGVRVTPTTRAIKPIHPLNSLAEFIPNEVYAAVAQVIPQIQDSKSKLVFYDKELGCLTVHPRVGGLAVGRMNVVVPKHAWCVSAQIHLAHERASPTDFGLMVCALRDENRELAKLNQLESPSQSFSGWRTLSPLETRSISAVLPASREDHLSVYLVTRQAPDLSPDFAWARFTKFEFNLLPDSLIGENGSEKPAPSSAGVMRSGDEFAIKAAEE